MPARFDLHLFRGERRSWRIYFAQRSDHRKRRYGARWEFAAIASSFTGTRYRMGDTTDANAADSSEKKFAKAVNRIRGDFAFRGGTEQWLRSHRQ
jgi:hypothetical protein